MLIVTVLACLVGIASCYALIRTRSRMRAIQRRLHEATAAIDETNRRLTVVENDNELLIRERDDALERGRRASRDASEVANRLTEATAALAQAQTESASLTDELARVVGENEVLSSALTTMREHTDEASATAMPNGLDVELLWGLMLAGVDRNWRINVAAGTEVASPLLGSRSLLRTALEVEVAAAREQSGVLVDLAYDGDTAVDAAASALTLSVARELIAAAATDADDVRLSVKVADSVEIVVDARDEEGTPISLRGPVDLEVRPGVFRVPRASGSGTTD